MRKPVKRKVKPCRNCVDGILFHEHSVHNPSDGVTGEFRICAVCGQWWQVERSMVRVRSASYRFIRAIGLQLPKLVIEVVRPNAKDRRSVP